MPCGCGFSSHHFHTSCSSSFFFLPPFVGEPVADVAATPFLGEETAFEALPFFLVGVVTTAGEEEAADEAFLLDEFGVFLDFFGYER